MPCRRTKSATLSSASVVKPVCIYWRNLDGVVDGVVERTVFMGEEVGRVNSKTTRTNYLYDEMSAAEKETAPFMGESVPN